MTHPVSSATAPPPPGHMIVCGSDALTHRLALELIHLYRERVTLIVPDADQGHGPQLAALATEDGSVTVIGGRNPDEATLLAAGITEATALALTMDDDPAVTQAALLARGLNANLRLVIRVFGSALGQRLENLLDREAHQNDHADGTTTVLSASETATPALVSAAVTDRNQLIPIDGGTFSVAESPVDAEPASGGPDGGRADGGRADGVSVPLALLAPRVGNQVGSDDNPVHTLLPSAEQAAAAVAGATARAVLRLRHDPNPPAPPRPRLPRLPLGVLFSRRLRLAALGLVGFVAVITGLTWLVTGRGSLGRAFYLVLMDVAGSGNPDPAAQVLRQVLQLVSVFTGMLIMPLVLALVLESLGALDNVSVLDRPRRTLSDHIVIIGLGKVGSRALERLAEMRVPVVAVERNPAAAGVARARKLQIPVVIGDISQPEVYRDARIGRCRTLMALTSNDSVNLEAVLYAREQKPDLRVVLRLFDDAFAGTVYRALKTSYPQAPTHSRSVSYLAAPAFAAAMMGRQVLAAIPVERQMLLVATVAVRGRPALAGRSVGEAFRPGGWRVVGLLGTGDRLDWNPAATRQLAEDDRVVVVATREGLGLLLRRAELAAAADGSADLGVDPAADFAADGSVDGAPDLAVDGTVTETETGTVDGGAVPGPVPGGPGVPPESGTGAPGRGRFRMPAPGAAPTRGSRGGQSPLPRLPRAQPSPPYLDPEEDSTG